MHIVFKSTYKLKKKIEWDFTNISKSYNVKLSTTSCQVIINKIHTQTKYYHTFTRIVEMKKNLPIPRMSKDGDKLKVTYIACKPVN